MIVAVIWRNMQNSCRMAFHDRLFLCLIHGDGRFQVAEVMLAGAHNV